jgi:hypothetical protein
MTSEVGCVCVSVNNPPYKLLLLLLCTCSKSDCRLAMSIWSVIDVSESSVAAPVLRAAA